MTVGWAWPAAPTSDCELIDDAGPAQDVNTWSSLGYVAVGIALGAALGRGRLTRVAGLLAVLMVAEGVGSAWFHGDPGDVAQWLHDVPFIGALGLLAGWHVGRLAGAGERGAWIGGLGATVVAGVLHPVATDAVNVAAAVLVAVTVLAEVVARRRRLPAAIRGGLIALVAVAVASYLLGRTGAPLCDPESLVQPHGAWHLLTALAVFVWADRALAVAGPEVGSGVGRGVADRVVGGAAIVLVHAFHRSVDVDGRRLVPHDRPVLVVANHGNGFVDPVVVAAALRRMPRFIAKAALWKVLPARPLLDGLAVLPVYRRADGDDPHGNDRTFEACHEALAREEIVAIFPEGTTGDRAGLDRVRSGAARIALGARDDGVASIAIVPVGLAFESRVDARTRAAVTFGDPLDLDAWCSNHLDRLGDERSASSALTDEIRGRLEAVSPVYHSVDEREQLRIAAAVALRARPERTRPPRFGEVEHHAATAARAPERARAEVRDALADHALRATMIGVGDDLGVGTRRGVRRLVLAALALIVLGPVIATAFVVHLPCLLAVRLAVGSVTSTATKGTVRLLVGLTTALLTWWVVGVVVADGFGPILLAMALTAAAGALALLTWTYVADGVTALVHAVRVRDRRQLLAGLDATRDRVVAAFEDAERRGASAVSD